MYRASRLQIETQHRRHVIGGADEADLQVPMPVLPHRQQELEEPDAEAALEAVGLGDQRVPPARPKGSGDGRGDLPSSAYLEEGEGWSQEMSMRTSMALSERH